MSCKNCDEQIVFIDGKPMSWQNHFKVCGRNGKAKPEPDPVRAAAYDALRELGFMAREARAMLDKATGKTPEELTASALQHNG